MQARGRRKNRQPDMIGRVACRLAGAGLELPRPGFRGGPAGSFSRVTAPACRWMTARIGPAELRRRDP